MLAGVAYICGGTQYQFERVSSRQVLFNACLVIFHACNFHDKLHDNTAQENHSCFNVSKQYVLKYKV